MPANLEGLKRDVRIALAKIEDRLRQEGIPYRVTSGFRNKEEQAALYRRYLAGDPGVPLAAKPGSSRHESGLAVDISVSPKHQKRLNALAQEAGMKWHGPSDRFHFEWASTGAPAPKQSRAAADFSEFSQYAPSGRAAKKPIARSAGSDFSEFAQYAPGNAKKPATAKGADDFSEFAQYAQKPTSPAAPKQQQPSVAGRMWQGLSAPSNAYAAYLQSLKQQGQALAPQKVAGFGDLMRAIPGALAAGGKGFVETFQGKDVEVPTMMTPEFGQAHPYLYGAGRLAENAAFMLTDPGNIVTGGALGLAGKGVGKLAKPVTQAIGKAKGAQKTVELAQGALSAVERRAARAGAMKERLTKPGGLIERRVQELAAAKEALAPVAASRERQKLAQQAVKLGQEAERQTAGAQTAALRGVKEAERRASKAGEAVKPLLARRDSAAARVMSAEEGVTAAKEAIDAAKVRGASVGEVGTLRTKLAKAQSKLSEERRIWSQHDAAVTAAQKNAEKQARLVKDVQARAASPAVTSRAAQRAQERATTAAQAVGASGDELKTLAQGAVPEYQSLAQKAAGAERRLARAQGRVKRFEGYEANLGKKAERLQQGVAEVQKAAAPTTALEKFGVGAVKVGEKVGGTKVAQAGFKLADLVGVGPHAAQRREAFKAADIAQAEAHNRVGQIAREMRDYTVSKRADKTFDEAERAYAQANEGRSRLQSFVQEYVSGHSGEGFSQGAKLDVADLAERAKAAGIDPADVQKFGDRILGEARAAVAKLKSAGGKPYELHKTVDAAARAREGDLRQLTEALFRKDRPQKLGEIGAQAFSGGGVKLIKDAHYQGLVDDLGKKGILRDVGPEGVKPGWVRLPAKGEAGYARDLGQLAGRQVPKVVWDRLTTDLARTEKIVTKLGRLTGTGSLDPVEKAATGLLGTVAKVTGAKKGMLLASPKTAIANIVSNSVFAGIGLERNGVHPGVLAKELGSALKEAAEFAKSGRRSPMIEELMQHSRAFLETHGSNLGQSGKTAAEIAGTSGKVVRAGGKAVRLPSVGEAAKGALGAPGEVFNVAERGYKLAMYKALRGKGMSPADAAKQVEKYLFDYSDRHAAMEALDRYGVAIFNVWPVKSTQLVMDTMLHRPDILARYDRIRRAAYQAEPGSEEQKKKLPPYMQGSGVLPSGKGEFTDVSRFLGFTEGLDIAKAAGKGDVAAVGKGLAKPFAEQKPPLLKDFELAKAFWATATGEEAKLPDDLTRNIHPGAPAERQMKDMAWELALNNLPRVVADVYRVRDSALGLAQGRKISDRPQTMPEALLQATTGLKETKAETKGEAVQRAIPEIRGRVPQIGKFAAQEIMAYRDGKKPNPYADRLAAINDPARLQRMSRETAKYLKQEIQNPRADKVRVGEAAALTWAIAQRMMELAREQVKAARRGSSRTQ